MANQHVSARLGLILFCLFNILFFYAGCFWSDSELEKAKQALQEQHFPEAIEYFERTIKRSPHSPEALEASRRGAQVALLQTKDFLQAIDFYRHLVVHSPDPLERKEAQKKIAATYFDKISDYTSAIKEYSKLLHVPHEPQEGFQAQFAIAKAYYQLNKFYQANVELEELLKREDLTEENRFHVMLFKANLLLTTKKLNAAIDLFSKLIDEYPEQSAQENVALNLAVAYEEQEELGKAIKILQDLKDSYATPEFLELKIKRLQERSKNMPGAQGYKK